MKKVINSILCVRETCPLELVTSIIDQWPNQPNFANKITSTLPCSCFLARNLPCWPSVACPSGSFSPQRTPFCRCTVPRSFSSFDITRHVTRARGRCTHGETHQRNTPGKTDRVDRVLTNIDFLFLNYCFLFRRSHGLSLDLRLRREIVRTSNSLRLHYVR